MIVSDGSDRQTVGDEIWHPRWESERVSSALGKTARNVEFMNHGGGFRRMVAESCNVCPEMTTSSVSGGGSGGQQQVGTCPYALLYRVLSRLSE